MVFDRLPVAGIIRGPRRKSGLSPFSHLTGRIKILQFLIIEE